MVIVALFTNCNEIVQLSLELHSKFFTRLFIMPLASAPDHSTDETTKESVRVYTKAEVKAHDKSDDCWVVIHGSVYDVTDFLESHPGGPEVRYFPILRSASLEQVISTISGGNVTEDFEEIGHSDEARRQAKAHRIGVLEGHEEVP